MTSNVPVKQITNAELVKLRSENQFCKLGLYIQRPATIYTMRVDGTPASLDGIVSLEYKGGSGTYTDAIAGMTVLVSASAYGKHDKGICRLRKVLPSATTGTISINITSDIQFADDDYLTVVNSMSIWQKDIYTFGDVSYADYDIPFGAYYGVVPRIAPIVSVINQTTGTITFTPPSPALSSCYDGTTIVSCLYNAPGALTTSNMTSLTGTASWTLPLTANKEYMWSCAITDNLGRTTTSYRWVIVNPTTGEFKLLSCSGDYDSGGWAFKVRSYSDMSDVYDRAMVVLYSSFESYGDTAGAIGRLAGYENIKAVGWIDGKTINVNPNEGYVEFEVKGASYWMSKISSLPFDAVDTATPANWGDITGLTVDKALAFLLFYGSTITQVMDCFFTENTYRIKELTSPAENLWQQINDISFGTVFAKPLVNSLGQLFIQSDCQIIDDTDRASVPVVQHVEKYDYQNSTEITINMDKTSLITLSGTTEWDGSNSFPLHAKAPGSTGGTLGDPISEDNYTFISQAECNRIAGRLLSIQNNPYNPIDLEMGGQNNFFDICPRQFATKNINAADNPLGLQLTAQKLIPRAIDLEYNSDSGFLRTVVTFEFVINSVDGVAYYPQQPADEDDSDRYITPDFDGAVKFPNSALGTFFPASIPAPINTPTCTNYTPNTHIVSWSKAVITSGETAQAYFPCILHGGVAVAFSKVTGHGGVIFAIKGGSRVASSDTSGVFNLASPLEIDGFEVEGGAGTTPTYTPGDYVTSGSVLGTAESGTEIATTPNEYYALESTGGYWYSGDGGAPTGNGGKNWSFWLSQNGVWTNGQMGLGFSPSDPDNVWYGTPQTGLLYLEALDGDIVKYARVYFKAAGTSFFFRCGDNSGQFSDNAGSLGFILRKAIVHEGETFLNQCIIQNVCAIGSMA